MNEENLTKESVKSIDEEKVSIADKIIGGMVFGGLCLGVIGIIFAIISTIITKVYIDPKLNSEFNAYLNKLPEKTESIDKVIFKPSTRPDESDSYIAIQGAKRVTFDKYIIQKDIKNPYITYKLVSRATLEKYDQSLIENWYESNGGMYKLNIILHIPKDYFNNT